MPIPGSFPLRKGNGHRLQLLGFVDSSSWLFSGIWYRVGACQEVKLYLSTNHL